MECSVTYFRARYGIDLMFVLKCWCWDLTGEVEYSVLVTLSSVTSDS